ncbi:MAG: GC-type dockerin domain-anchored protein [Planctomycetota bacterium]
MSNLFRTATIAFVLTLSVALTDAASAQPFEMRKQVIAGGGARLEAGQFQLTGTVNATAGGRLEAGQFRLTGGLYPLGGSGGIDCPADTNGDGLVNPADFNAWVIAFNTQSPACDQNADGLCNPADFNAWVLNFNNGC